MNIDFSFDYLKDYTTEIVDMKKPFTIVLFLLAIIMMTYSIDIIKKYINTSEKIPDDIKADLNMANIPASIYQSVQTMPDTNNVICQKPINSEYGGIAGSENSPPNGTIVIKNYYGDILATGICGMYWNIAGWWFNESEMMNLPSESVMYKIT